MPPHRSEPANAPSPEDLRAYSAGALTPERFDAVDRWLSVQDPATQERLLGTAAAGGSLAGNARLEVREPTTSFNAELGGGTRFSRGATIGAGGMGIVELVTDRVLGRDIVVKRCRPRRPDESLAGYHRRQELFEREARLTAQLEHPGIVPVHDVGAGPLGEPAFTMKRLEGEPLSAMVGRRRAGEALDAPRLVEIILRVADAVGYAHRRGLVHRDLKPDNIIVGQLGAVYVIDWGLAGGIGATPSGDAAAAAAMPPAERRLSGSGMGTLAWMAPEQFQGLQADPRMDVFAIGGLLMAALTGRGPRDRGVPPGSPAVSLADLDLRLPRGLVAVARRCLAVDPAARYADATQVADELRQWLAAGLTTAENPGWLARLISQMRRSRRLSAVALGVVAALACLAVGAAWWDWLAKKHARAEIQHIAATLHPEDLSGLREAQLHVQLILSQFTDLPGGAALDTTLDNLIAAARSQAHAQGLATELTELEHDVRLRGSWTGEVADLSRALQDFSLTLTTAAVPADAALIDASPQRDDLLLLLAYLERAYLVNGRASPMTTSIPLLISRAAPDASWAGMATLLTAPLISSHDLWLPDQPSALAAVAASPVTADLALALFAPYVPAAGEEHDDDDPGHPQPMTLLTLMQMRLRQDPGAFWPRIAAARSALMVYDYHSVERNALIALGTEPQSIWPHLLLSYTELAAHDWANVLTFALEGLSINPDQLELIALRCVAMAALGSPVQAQLVLNETQAGAVLRWHLYHPDGHPLERVIKEMHALGLRIPAADPAWGPLVIDHPRP